MRIYSIILAFMAFNAVNSQEPLIRISQGILRGITLTNRDGGKFYGFRSIPYAQPPINELRFKAPRPADGWEGIRDATVEIPTCTQFTLAVPAASFGEEDCLYLNVFTPELPSQNATKRPVMVFIHGGAFMWGTTASILYGPEFLLTKDVILVTFNYRLGVLGFLTSDDPELEVPGNAGLKDQVLALQWVRDNIGQFGGDPDNVLIFGDSAGSISVHLHKLSPVSAGLFNKVIGQSGSAIMPLYLGARNTAVLIAEQLGVQTENLGEMLKTLQEIPATEISDAAQIIAETGDNLFFVGPVIELPSSERAFLAKNPIDIVLSGNYSHVSFLTGFNDLEGLFWEQLSLDLTGQSILIEDFTEFIPEDLQIAPGSEEEKALTARIKEFYYGDTESNRDDIMPAVDLYSDFAFCFPAYRAALEHTKLSSEDVFLYYLSADTELNFMKQVVPRLRDFRGAAHGDERGYLFQTIFTPFSIPEGSAEDFGIRTMVNLWTNFATYGNPTPDDSLGFKWEPVREDAVNFFYIGTNLTYAGVNPRSKNMDFWSGIYEDYFPRKRNIYQ